MNIVITIFKRTIITFVSLTKQQFHLRFLTTMDFTIEATRCNRNRILYCLHTHIRKKRHFFEQKSKKCLFRALNPFHFLTNIIYTIIYIGICDYCCDILQFLTRITHGYTCPLRIKHNHIICVIAKDNYIF